jgi:vancomycin permeability regulator SanA
MPFGLSRAWRITFGVLAGALALFLTASFYVEFRHSRRIHRIEDAPSAPVALIFGAGLSPGRSVSPILAQRLEAAAQLLQAGKVQQLLLSGDNSDRYHDEPDAMMRYLAGQGVLPAQMVADPLGLSTYDSCYRAKHLYGLDKVLLVTQDFHLPRAIFIARAIGLDADGVAADKEPNLNPLYEARELVSRAWALVAVLMHPEPSLERR